MGMEKFPYVQMSFECRVLDANGNVHPNPEGIEEFSFGGYCFIVDGKFVPFDWDACSWNFQNEVVKGETGYGSFFNEFELSDYADDELAGVGLTRHDLTPKFLSHCEKIEEFFCEGGDVLINHIVFHDEEGNDYPVSRNVIEAFNKEVMEKYGKI